jgi:hypothetical protein
LTLKVSTYRVEREAECPDINEVGATPINLQRSRVDHKIQFGRIGRPVRHAGESECFPMR